MRLVVLRDVDGGAERTHRPYRRLAVSGLVGGTVSSAPRCAKGDEIIPVLVKQATAYLLAVAIIRHG